MEELNDSKIDFEKLTKLAIRMRMLELFEEPYDPPDDEYIYQTNH